MTVGKVLLASLRPIPNIRGDNSEILKFRDNFWYENTALKPYHIYLLIHFLTVKVWIS